MRGGIEKAVLRDAAEGVLPDDIRLRRKTGFMLTTDAIDFFGADRKVSGKQRHHLSRQAFERAQIFSYGPYRVLRLLARVPATKRLPFLKRLRRDSNKVLMYMMQTHMLHHMFVADPPWKRPFPDRVAVMRSPCSPANSQPDGNSTALRNGRGLE
jgi:hypothetical protein